MTTDIELYLNSVYCGFWNIDKIEEFFNEYYESALELSNRIDWDEIILYAILNYDGESQTLISADFMQIRMNYDQYVELAGKLSKDCRLFFVKNQQED